jgi:hypothetical protein
MTGLYTLILLSRVWAQPGAPVVKEFHPHLTQSECQDRILKSSEEQLQRGVSLDNFQAGECVPDEDAGPYEDVRSFVLHVTLNGVNQPEMTQVFPIYEGCKAVLVQVQGTAAQNGGGSLNATCEPQ